MSNNEEIVPIKRILAVDDHEMTAIGYKYILEDAKFDGFEVLVDTCKTFENAKERIENSERLHHYDIFLFDIQLFGPESKDARTGEDLGKLARKVAPSSKLVYMSSFNDAYRIRNIFKTTDPDGYMVKSEIDQASLLEMVNRVLTKPPYFTASVLKVMRKTMANSDTVDEQDKKLLYYLSIGKRSKEIQDILSISLATINARKRHLKEIFNLEKSNDMGLVTEARNRGFI